jgi:hypothetical protein
MKTPTNVRRGPPMSVTVGTLDQHWNLTDVFPFECGILANHASVTHSRGSPQKLHYPLPAPMTPFLLASKQDILNALTNASPASSLMPTTPHHMSKYYKL